MEEPYENLIIEPYALYPSESSVVIRWTSKTASCDTLVYWETSDSDQVQATTVTEKEAFQFHSICLYDLKPLTFYSYRVAGSQKIYQFRTATTHKTESFRFIVFGDPQGHKHLQEMMAVVKMQHVDFAIGLGDFVGKAIDENYRHYFNKSRELLDSTALYPTPGNHDYHCHNRPFDHDNNMDIYDRYLGNDKGNNYIFDYGTIRFIMLNYPDADTLNVDSGSGKWLFEQLTIAQNLKKKVILSHHCPCFTSTTIDWAVDDSFIPPLLENFQDTVIIDFGAHIHTYERSHYPNQSGVCYITTGGVGELYDYPVNQRENKYQSIALDACHICLVEIHNSTVKVQALGLDGNVLDCFDLQINS